MIQIFEIVQDGGTGFWSENKDLIAAFGVFISFLAAAASIWAIRINKKTLDEIKTQRILSYAPDLVLQDFEFKYIFDEVFLADGVLFPNEISYIKQDLKIKEGIGFSFPILQLIIQNVGLGTAKNITAHFDYDRQNLISFTNELAEKLDKKYKFSIHENDEFLHIANLNFNKRFNLTYIDSPLKVNLGALVNSSGNESKLYLNVHDIFWYLYTLIQFYNSHLYMIYTDTATKEEFSTPIIHFFLTLNYKDIGGLFYEKKFKIGLYISEILPPPLNPEFKLFTTTKVVCEEIEFKNPLVAPK